MNSAGKSMLVCTLLSGVLEGFAEETQWKQFPIWGGGYVQNVEISKSSPNVWYTYVDVCGPYRSDDAGNSWRPLHQVYSINERYRGMNPRSLSIDPRNPDSIVYVAGNSWNLKGNIYVSRDGGKSVRAVVKDLHFYGNGYRRWTGILLDRNPFNPDELITAPDSDGIFRGTENGEKWENAGLKDHFFTDIRYDLAVPGRIYACAPAVAPERSADRKPRQTGFYRSDDNGKTWKRLQETAPEEIKQARAKGNPLLGIFDMTELRISEDAGATWKPYSEGLPEAGKEYITNGRFQAIGAGSDFFLAVDTAGTVYRRNIGDPEWKRVIIRRRINREYETGGQLRTAQWFGRAAASINIDPRDEKHWIMTDWFAIWETFDAGKKWQTAIRNICQLISFTVAADPFDGNNLIYGVADVVFFTSRNGGKSFEHDPSHYSGILGGVCSIAFSRISKGVAFICGGKQGSTTILRSKDGMKTWARPALKGLPKLEYGKCAVYTLAANPKKEEIFACVSGPVEPGKGGVYKSTDMGDTWVWFSAGLPADMSYASGEWDNKAANPQIAVGPDGSAVTFNRKTKQLYYLADREKGIWKASDLRYTSWALPVIAADPFVPGHYLAGCAANEYAESFDGGKTFRRLTTVPETIESISFDEHNPGWVALGCTGKLRVSRDGGKTFEVIEDAMSLPGGHSMRTILDRKRLFLITGANGVYTKELK